MTPTSGVVSAMQNPFSRRMVRLIPPIEIYSDDEFETFFGFFQAECARVWKNDDWDAKDPKTMDASGWRDACEGSPAGC